MNNARENIMRRIRQANLQCGETFTVHNLEQRTQQHSRGPQPQWPEDLTARFIQKVNQSAATVAQIKEEQDIVNAVSAYLAEQSLDTRLLCASTGLIDGLNWPDGMSIESRSATASDRAVLVEAFAGIAETGSIIMYSSKKTPVSLNFLPDYYLCVIHHNNIVKTVEDVWQKIREQGSGMPRAINIITGPSRTADVEQIIQMGAHGPRKVHLLLLG